jgi:hypothetical protein
MIDDLVKSQKSDGTVIPPWRDRWTFYEAVNIPFEITVCTNPAMRKEGVRT